MANHELVGAGSPRACHQCQHFLFETGSPGYSEMTPGYDASLYCAKDHWAVKFYNDSRDDVRRKLATAETCPDFTKWQG